jgi:translation initiation factor 2-alpha kinase 4
LQALEAIYGDDYEQIEVKGAWSKPTDRSFKLKLKAAPEDEDYVTLTVRLTATYPKTVPILQVEDLNGWHERTQQRIRNIVTNRPKQLLGQVMVFEIASEIRDALEDAIQAKQQGTYNDG